MYGYIYKTTNLINGKIYIGQKKSKTFVKTYLGSGTIIQRAIKKYGVENFDVVLIEECFSKEELCEREIFHIAKEESLYNFGKGYNITPGGEFGDTFTHHPNKDEIRRKISIAGKGRKHTEEWKKQASKRYSGKGNPMYGVTSPMKGKKQSLESIEKRVKALKGRVVSEEKKEQMKEKYRETIKNRTPEKQKEIFNNRSKATKERYKKYDHPQNKKVYVYKKEKLVNEFKNSIECKEYYFNNYKLSKKTIINNLIHNKPILPENTRGIRKDNFEIRKQFKDYNFTHTKR